MLFCSRALCRNKLARDFSISSGCRVIVGSETHTYTDITTFHDHFSLAGSTCVHAHWITNARTLPIFVAAWFSKHAHQEEWGDSHRALPCLLTNTHIHGLGPRLDGIRFTLHNSRETHSQGPDRMHETIRKEQSYKIS